MFPVSSVFFLRPATQQNLHLLLNWSWKRGVSLKNKILLPKKRYSWVPLFFRGKSTSKRRPIRDDMKYFVIGVSGVTCGGKTTLTKLLQHTFPRAKLIHQDTYFYPDNHPNQIRVPEVNNHVNYELMESMNMPQMYEDLKKILTLTGPPEFMGTSYSQDDDTPNFKISSQELLKSIGPLDFTLDPKYHDIPILIVEGFIIFGSQYIFDICDVRFFATLDETECRNRRSTRNYDPPDCPGYFDKIVWPEYTKHFKTYVDKRPGITVFSGKDAVKRIWDQSVQIIKCRMEEKYFKSDDKVDDDDSTRNNKIC